MSTTSAVRIISVEVDASHTNVPSQKRYRIRLACGCSWWEDHAEGDAPRVGNMASCFAQHSASAAVA